MAIRYNKALQNDINRVVRNFNQKISRLEKSERDLILPERVSIRELKKEVNNKWELNRRLKELSTFTQRGAEEIVTTKAGVKLPKYEIINLERERKRVYNKLGRNIKKIGNIRPSSFGIREDVTYAQMGTEQLSNLKARRRHIGTGSIQNLTSEEIKDLKNVISKTVQKEKYLTQIFMNNYIEKMIFPVGYAIGYDNEKLRYIKEQMMNLTERQFLNMYNSDLGIQKVKDLYIESKNPNLLARNIEDAKDSFDALYESIDDIVKSYKK